MTKYRLPLLVIGIVLIVAAAGWKWGISERWSKRLPDGWKWEVNVIGSGLYPDEATGEFPPDREFPADDDLNITERVVSISDENAPEGAVVVTDHNNSYDINTNAPIWNFTSTALVDPETGRHATEEFRDDYFMFPRNTEKITYHIRYSSYKGLPLEFVGEEEIEGLTAYYFAFEGEMDNTTAYTEADPPTVLEENQLIRCQELYLQVWVEPLTGEIIKYNEGCSGDYVYDTTTNENLYPLSRWSAVSTGDDVIRRANEIRAQRRTLLWTTMYIPLLLLAAGVVTTGAGVVGLMSNRAV